MARMRVPFTLALAVCAACSGDPEGTVSLTVGDEADALTRSPAPTTLVVETLGLDRSRKEIARVALPADSLDLGELQRSDVGALAVSALDPTGKVLLRGETLYMQWGALEQTSLDVFIQRTGELARVPRGPGAFDAKQATVAVGRYVLLANETSTFLYDLLNLRPLDGPPILPRAARSLTTYDTTAIVIDDTAASVFELQTRRASDLPAPAGTTFAEVSGGATIRASDGTQFIVGATRASGGPTPRILRVGADGAVTAVSLVHPRQGACAAWVEGRGLVVYGGNAAAPAGEVLAPGATQSSVLPFPPDDVTACGATALDGTHLLVAGKDARVLDLACAADCKPAPWPGALDLVRAEAFTLAADAALVCGDDATGATKVFRVSAQGPREVPLKNPRRGAHLVALPQNAMAAIVGGGAPGIEQYAE